FFPLKKLTAPGCVEKAARACEEEGEIECHYNSVMILPQQKKHDCGDPAARCNQREHQQSVRCVVTVVRSWHCREILGQLHTFHKLFPFTGPSQISCYSHRQHCLVPLNHFPSGVIASRRPTRML